MGRQENIEIFKDTEKLCKENAAIKEALQKSRKGQKLIPEDVEMSLIDKSVLGIRRRLLSQRSERLRQQRPIRKRKRLFIILHLPPIREAVWSGARMRRKNVFVDVRTYIFV